MSAALAAGISLDRLQFIHRVLQESRGQGFEAVPALAMTPGGETIAQLDGALFDMQTWLTGAPLGKHLDWDQSVPNRVQRLPRERLEALSAAVAAFHRSTARLTPGYTGMQRPLSQQLVMVQDAVAGLGDTLDQRRVVRVGAADRRLVSRWLACLPGTIERVGAALAADPECGADVSTICHGDLWAAHIFFDDATVTGLADFESLGVSSPAQDLAQLILHFNGWDKRAVVLRAYSRTRLWPTVSEACIAAAALLDLASEACWSLQSLYGVGEGPLDRVQRAAHRFNLRMLLRSLEAIDRTW